MSGESLDENDMVPSCSPDDIPSLPTESGKFSQYLDEDDITTSEDEVHFNYSRNLTEENAVLNTPELDTNSPTYKQNPTATVLQHLDAILLEKINLEIEDFRFSLHNLLSEQQTRVHQLLQLAEPNLSNLQSLSSPVQNQPPTDVTLPQIDTVSKLEEEKTRCVLELFTYAARLTKTLRRPEYQS